jgi:hypothetical protein
MNSLTVEVSGWLVEQKQPRTSRQCHRERQPLLFSRRKLERTTIQNGFEVELAHRSIEQLAAWVQRSSRLDLFSRRAQKQLGADSIEAGRHQVGSLTGIEIADLLATELKPTFDLPGSQPRQKTRYRVQQSGFSAATAPENTGYVPRSEAQRNLAENRGELTRNRCCQISEPKLSARDRT